MMRSDHRGCSGQRAPRPVPCLLEALSARVLHASPARISVSASKLSTAIRSYGTGTVVTACGTRGFGFSPSPASERLSQTHW